MTTVLHQFNDLRPFGGFDLIMADPPWRYEMRSEKGETRSPQAKYACMTIEEIAALPVAALAAPNCLLWLWGLNTMLPQALRVIEAWGFEYKTSGHWVKTTVNGKLNMGMGYILRGSGEPFLIGTRGAPKTTSSTRSVIMGQIREHSRKPEEAFVEAEKLMQTHGASRCSADRGGQGGRTGDTSPRNLRRPDDGEGYANPCQ